MIIMNRNLRTLGISLSLATLLTGCSPYIKDEKPIHQGTVNGNDFTIIKENWKWDGDKYRLEFYNDDGVCVIKTPITYRFTLSGDNKEQIDHLNLKKYDKR